MESDRIRLTAGVDGSPSGEWSGLLALFLSVYLGMALISLLGKAFPNANLDWLWFVLLFGMFVGVIGVLVYIGLQRVWIEPTGACVTFGNKPIWGIAASQLQFIALVGNDTEAALCLSAKTIDELAALREKQLLKTGCPRMRCPCESTEPNGGRLLPKSICCMPFEKVSSPSAGKAA